MHQQLPTNFPQWESICTARAPRAAFAASTRAGLILPPPAMAPKESKPIAHRICINTPPSHEHCTIKREGMLRCLKGATCICKLRQTPS